MAVRQSEACIYNIPTKDIHVALFLTEINFPTISNRQNQSVVNAFIYVLSPCPPTPVKGESAQDDDKGTNKREKYKIKYVIFLLPSESTLDRRSEYD